MFVARPGIGMRSSVLCFMVCCHKNYSIHHTNEKDSVSPIEARSTEGGRLETKLAGVVMADAGVSGARDHDEPPAPFRFMFLQH